MATANFSSKPSVQLSKPEVHSRQHFARSKQPLLQSDTQSTMALWARSTADHIKAGQQAIQTELFHSWSRRDFNLRLPHCQHGPPNALTRANRELARQPRHSPQFEAVARRSTTPPAPDLLHHTSMNQQQQAISSTEHSVASGDVHARHDQVHRRRARPVPTTRCCMGLLARAWVGVPVVAR